MSNSRRSRRNVAGYQLRQQLDAADRASITAITDYDAAHDAILKGGALFLLPKLVDGMPPEVANAVDRRRRATLTGRCDCGATRDNHTHPTRNRPPHAAILHDTDCPAGDTNIIDLCRRHGWRWTA